MKAVFVFCEGEHDIAFLSRVLLASEEFIQDDSRLKDFPEPIQKILINRFEERHVEKVEASKYSKMSPPVLWDALRPRDPNSEVRFWFFCAFGQNQHKAVGKFIRQVKLSVKDAQERDSSCPISSLAFAFLYDADEEGDDVKVAQWRVNYNETFVDEKPAAVAGWQANDASAKIQMGLHILCGHGQTTGDLEDIVLPLMKAQSCRLYDEASAFVDTHWNSDKTKKKRKASITAAGQVHSPASSMAVILRDTPHLDPASLNQDAACQKIVSFFRNVCREG